MTGSNPPQPARAIGRPPAADLDRSLLLTPGQDLVGYLSRLAGRGLLTLITSTSIIAVLLIFLFILKESWSFFSSGHAVQLFTSTGWYPQAQPPEFGGLALLVGSGLVTAGAMAIAVPAGLLAAVFLSDIVSFRARQVVKPVLEILAAIPSVAYGFFAVLVLAPWMQRHLGLPTGTNALNASIMLAIMAVPTIVSLSEDALTAAGSELRAGAYALGATRAEVLLKVIIPAAHSGIIAAVVLGVMRAVGETMVVWMASGNASQIPHPWWDLTQSVRTMTATVAGEMGETEKGSTHYHALFAIGLLLLALTLVMNMASEYFMARAKRISRGKRT